MKSCYAVAESPQLFQSGDDVTPTRGKWKGYKGHVMYESYAHPLNPKERVYAVRLQTGTIRGYITLRIQEKNLRRVKT